ncbi:hypothetical protein G7Y89_g10737 [Cudoniella acicularis]|uniref:Transcription factor domain-containing protein n=1 Tax=Cudoniella acicularis TaxID=354080 RepID=A0A8H4RDQ1_9HELO|nr:hypothetical protein G7Y89_g10737 [Cudoniella acicularis]
MPRVAQPTLLSDPESKSKNADWRSQIAMEELASLMLTMNVEDKGEPSFMISSGTGKPLSIALEKHSPEILSDRTNSKAQTSSNPWRALPFLASDELNSIVATEERTSKPNVDFRNQALFSVGAYFSPLPGIFILGAECASLAENMVLECIRSNSSEFVAQGLSLLAWRELMLGNDSMGYNYIAMATGVILRLGLHVTAMSQTSALGLSDDLAFRRKVRSFWTYFSVDRAQRSIRRIQELAHRWKIVWALPLNLSQPLDVATMPLETSSATGTTGEAAAESASHDAAEDFSSSAITFDFAMDQNIPGANLWDPNQYEGALDQIDSSWDMDLLHLEMFHRDFDT